MAEALIKQRDSQLQVSAASVGEADSPPHVLLAFMHPPSMSFRALFQGFSCLLLLPYMPEGVSFLWPPYDCSWVYFL